MIAKDTTTTVNFYVADTDGLPATGKASSITASISIDGGSASSISATISETDSTNLPGWYRFTYTFSTAGNVFITFTCSGCTIMPWEEQVIDIASKVWSHNIGGSSAQSLLSDISIGLPTESSIADAVWCWTSANAGDTPTVNSTYQKMLAIPANVWVVPSRALTSISVSYQGDNYTLATAADILDIYNAVTFCATSSEVQLLASGMLHWAVSGNTLTLYNNNNTSLGTYTLTRDSEGNITSVTPNA